MRDVTYCFLLHFIFELLSIFMVMMNIVNIELINATENCQLNIFSVRNSFLPTELFLTYPIFMWSRSRGIDIIWIKILHNILSNEWESKVVHQKNFPVRKKLPILFIGQSVSIEFCC